MRLFQASLVCAAGLVLAGCANLTSSKLNPKNWGANARADNGTVGGNANLPGPSAPSWNQPQIGGSPTGGVLAGQVVDSFNYRRPGAAIIVTPSDGPGRPQHVVADDQGYFTIQGLEPGKRYNLAARAKRGEQALAGMTMVTAPNAVVSIKVREDLYGAGAQAWNQPRGNTSLGAYQTGNPMVGRPTGASIYSGWTPSSQPSSGSTNANTPPNGSNGANGLQPPGETDVGIQPPVPVQPRPPQPAYQTSAPQPVRTMPRLSISGPPVNATQPGIVTTPLEKAFEQPTSESPASTPSPAPTPIRSEAPPMSQTPAPVASPAPVKNRTFETSSDVTGSQVKHFMLKDLKGNPYSFRPHQAKLTLLDFWGTWCAPCIQAMPHLAELKRRYGPMGFEVIGLAYEEGSVEEQAQRVNYIRVRQGINYPLVLGGGNRCPVSTNLGVRNFPTLVLVDHQGKVVWRGEGATAQNMTALEAEVAHRLPVQ